MGFERGCQRRAARQRPKHTWAERDRWGRAAETIGRRARGGARLHRSAVNQAWRAAPSPLRRGVEGRGARGDGGRGIPPRKQPQSRSWAARRPPLFSCLKAWEHITSAPPGRLAGPARGPVGPREASRARQAALLPARPRPALATRCCLINVQIEQIK